MEEIRKRPECCCICGRHVFGKHFLTTDVLCERRLIPEDHNEWHKYIYWKAQCGTVSSSFVVRPSSFPACKSCFKLVSNERAESFCTINGYRATKYSKLNTGIEFRTAEEYELFHDLSLVEESLISIVSPMIVVQEIKGNYNR
jgi:hypothetical protein